MPTAKCTQASPASNWAPRNVAGGVLAGGILRRADRRRARHARVVVAGSRSTAGDRLRRDVLGCTVAEGRAQMPRPASAATPRASGRSAAAPPGERSEPGAACPGADSGAASHRTVPDVYPGAYVGEAPDRPAVVMAGSGRVADLSPSSTPPPTGCAAAPRAGLRPGDHVALCMENHPRYLEVAVGLPLRRAGLHRVLVPAHRRRARLHRRRLRCRGVHLLGRDGRAGRRRSSPTTPERRARGSMLDGTDRRLRALRGRASPRSRRPRCRRPDRRHRHALLVGHDRAAQGCRCRRSTPAARARAAVGRTALLQMLFGVHRGRRSTSPRRRCTTPRRCASRWRCTALGGTVVVMEHFDAEAFLAARSSAPGHAHAVGADDVRPHAEAPRRGRAPLRRVVAAGVIHAAAPCPVPVKQQMIEWCGPVVHEYYAGTEGNGFVYCNSEQWLAHPARSARRSAARSTSSTTTATSCRPARPGTVCFEGGATFEYHNDPEKTASVAPPEGVEHARRRRLPRRGRLPVPHRPQGVHDHHRRREHLPAGGRERPRHPSRR